MPEPSAADLAREAEQKQLFSLRLWMFELEKLLNILRSLDPAKDNLAGNEEIQVWVHLLFYWRLIV